MQNQKLQTSAAIVERAFHTRLTAGLLVGTILLAALTIEHESRNYLREAISRPAYTALSNLERENETARIPVRFDIGLRLPTISGA